jgi:hypothetical protein
LIITLVFKEKRHFLPKIVENRRKLWSQHRPLVYLFLLAKRKYKLNKRLPISECISFVTLCSHLQTIQLLKQTK